MSTSSCPQWTHYPNYQRDTISAFLKPFPANQPSQELPPLSLSISMARKQLLSGLGAVLLQSRWRRIQPDYRIYIADKRSCYVGDSRLLALGCVKLLFPVCFFSLSHSLHTLSLHTSIPACCLKSGSTSLDLQGIAQSRGGYRAIRRKSRHALVTDRSVT